MLIGHSYMFFYDVSVQMFCPFLKVGCFYYYCVIGTFMYPEWQFFVKSVFCLFSGLLIHFLNDVF